MNFNSGYPPPPTQSPYLNPQATGWQQQSPLQSQSTGWQQPQMQQPSLLPQATGWQQQQQQPSPYLQPQHTSYLQPQQTGWQSPQPQLNLMTQSLLPNQQPSYSSSTLTNTLQNSPAPKVPWKLSRDEKRNYDQLFRAWDTLSTGFISGDQSRQIFGQSGLPSDDLMMIWNLADVDNRGKLNLAEFHVAMALVYRREFTAMCIVCLSLITRLRLER